MARFAHLADVHLGGWRDDKLKELGMQAFTKTVDKIIKRKTDFVVIAGDFFNTALPNLDAVKLATKELARLREYDIPVYMIYGSHDYSPSGKTMLDVLENARLIINVQKAVYTEDNKIRLQFTKDEKTGIKITGLPGKKGALEVQYYDNLDYESAQNEPGKKIFLFHMLLTEFKRKKDEKIQTVSSSILPKRFMYYGGGHPHLVDRNNYFEGIIAYPGPLFPNNYEELEELRHGGFYIVDEDEGIAKNIEWIPIIMKNVKVMDIDCSDLTPERLNEKAIGMINELQLLDTILLIRMQGKLSGKTSDISWSELYKAAFRRGCYTISRNVSRLSGIGREEIELNYRSKENVEDSLIEEFEQKSTIPKSLGNSAVRKLFAAFSEEKKEGETNSDFITRLKESFNKEFGLIKDDNY